MLTLVMSLPSGKKFTEGCTFATPGFVEVNVTVKPAQGAEVGSVSCRIRDSPCGIVTFGSVHVTVVRTWI
jgi:hypothetical protein